MPSVQRNEKKAIETPIASIILALSLVTGVHSYKLAKAFNKSQAAMLEYLKILHSNGLLTKKKSGKRIVYSFNSNMTSILEDMDSKFINTFSKAVKIKHIDDMIRWDIISFNKEVISKAYRIYKKKNDEYTEKDSMELITLGEDLTVAKLIKPFVESMQNLRYIFSKKNNRKVQLDDLKQLADKGIISEKDRRIMVDLIDVIVEFWPRPTYIDTPEHVFKNIIEGESIEDLIQRVIIEEPKS